MNFKMDIYKYKDAYFEKFYKLDSDAKYKNEWDNWRVSQVYRFKMSLNLIKPILQSNYNMDILDVGCGVGDFIKILLENVELKLNKIKAIDVSQNSIDICNRIFKGSNIEFECMKLPQLLYSSNSYNMVICLEVLECFSYSGRKQCLKEFKRVLKDKGYILLSTHVYKNDMRPKQFLKEISREFKIKKVEYNYNNLYQFIEVPLTRFCNKYYICKCKGEKNFLESILCFLGKLVYKFLKSEKIMEIFIIINRLFLKNEIRNVLVLAQKS